MVQLCGIWLAHDEYMRPRIFEFPVFLPIPPGFLMKWSSSPLQRAHAACLTLGIVLALTGTQPSACPCPPTSPLGNVTGLAVHCVELTWNNLPMPGFCLLGFVTPGGTSFCQESGESQDMSTVKYKAAIATKTFINYFSADLSQQTSASPPSPGSFQGLWFCL